MNRIRPIPRQQSLIAPEIRNPFVHKLHLGYLDMIKIGVMSVTVAPLRLLLVGLCLVLAWPLAALAVMGRTPEEAKQPLSGWRKCFDGPLMTLGRIMMFFWGFQNVKVHFTLVSLFSRCVYVIQTDWTPSHGHGKALAALAVLWLTLCQFNTCLEIEFLPVYKPSAEEIADPKLFAHNVRELMARALNVPVTDHTFDDCRLMEKARLLNLPMEAGLVEFQKLHKKLGVSLDQMQALLEKFSSITTGTTNGQVSLHEFSKYLQLPDSPALRDVFALYDRDGSGTIDFREYVIGLSLVSTPANTDSTISLAFQLFDSSQRGYISRDDLCLILHNAFNMTQVDVDNLFEEIDADKDGKITFEEFQNFANDHPEYAPLFVAFQNHKIETTSSNAAATEPRTNSITPPTENDQEHVKSE